MKAIVKTKAEHGIEVLDLEKPSIDENEFLVKVKAGSLCGSDMHIYEWTHGYEWIPVPVVLGHEFAGEVVEIGSSISEISVGDRITADPTFTCGECEFCRFGKGSACQRRKGLGFNTNGAFAEYVKMNGTAQVFKIPDNVSDETASLCEPLAVALNGIDLSNIKPGQTAAVFGPGPIGLLTIQLLKAAGAGHIIVTGTSADNVRLEIAAMMGADAVIVVDKEDPVKRANEIAGKLDFVFEATGVAQTINQGLKMLKKGGKVMMIGIHADDVTFDAIDLVRQSKSLIGTYAYHKDTWERSLELMSSRRIDIDPIITHRFPFSQGVEGFELAANREAAKVIFVPEN
ncbi:MAG: alcohol dehydrogenase catalytic domain-containing protein [Proteobacteria bacterium]|nr:alcohol dehydrogenase catalytic domain-containing protein [Pseudomonadota bacterium]